MPWDGIERRQSPRTLGFCPAHIELVSDMAVIKTSLKNIESVITEGISFKNAVIMGFISIAFAIVVQVVAFSFLFGQINKQVEVNTQRLSILEESYRGR